MNLRFVEAFVWVARLKSITRGAEKLFLTQSAVSNRIAALEEELGTQLLDRRHPSFRLSDAGTRFLVYADRLLALQSELKNELGTPAEHPFSLRVGAIESVLHSWLIPMVDGLKKIVPKIEFELSIETTPLLNEQIKRGALDLVFSAQPATGEGIASEAMPSFEMVLVGPEQLASATMLSVDELLGHELMTFQRGSQPHLALISALRSAGAGDKRVHSISSVSALVRLVDSGFGLATLPRAVTEQLRQRNGIRVLDSALPLDPLPIFASYWSGPAAPALKPAIDAALSIAKAYRGTTAS